MEHIFRSHLAQRQGLSAQEIAEEKEMARMAAASVRHEMGEAASAGNKRMHTEAELEDEAHDEREAAIDAQLQDGQQKHKKKKLNKHKKKHAKGTVPQHMWEEEELHAAKTTLQQRTSSEQSELGKLFKCTEWRKSKGQQQYVQFCGIAYSFQTLAYFATHPDDVLQQNMSVLAYPCENELCITPEHLYLRAEAKRGKLNTNLPPLDDTGRKCTSRSQEKMLQLRNEIAPVGTVIDPYLTEPISLFDYCKMTQAEQERFQLKSVYTKK
jgi:hypothetical protein